MAENIPRPDFNATPERFKPRWRFRVHPRSSPFFIRGKTFADPNTGNGPKKEFYRG
jgi:hypothetical protein